MKEGTTNRHREIPATRVAAFIQHYIKHNIETDVDVDDAREGYDAGLTQFAFEAGLNPRAIYRILHGETTNCKFELVDDMLTALDRSYLWTWDPEDGGFADYYCDEPAPKAEPTIEQKRRNELQMAKRVARRDRRDWLEVLMERARAQMELQCA